MRGMTTLLLIGIGSGTALGTSINTGGPQEGFFNFAYVRGQDGSLVRDSTFARELSARLGRRYASIDVVMQQCWGGGFANDVETELNGRSYTFASAGSYQPVINTDRPLLPGDDPRQVVDNFTRAWRADAELNRGRREGMLGYFNTARNGRPAGHRRPAIPKDPGAVPTSRTDGAQNHPQYRSNGAADDTRELGGANQYAILAAWGNYPALGRHEVNIARINNTLRNTYGLPAARVAVLGARNVGNFAAGVGPDDFGGLNGVNRNAQGSLNNLRNALNGAYFPGAALEGNARLLVYFTGHGGNGADLRAGFDNIRRRIINGTRYLIDLVNQFRVLSSTDTDDDQTFASADGSQMLQFSFEESALGIVDSALLMINGITIGSLGAPLFEGSEGVRPLDESVEDVLVHYQVWVDRSVLGLDPSTTTIDFVGLDFDMYSDLIRGITFVGGDQEFMAILPEPASLALLGLPLLLILRSRIKRS